MSTLPAAARKWQILGNNISLKLLLLTAASVLLHNEFSVCSLIDGLNYTDMVSNCS